MSDVEAVPEGLAPAGDGTYYGTHQAVPTGWEYWHHCEETPRTRGAGVNGGLDIVQCRPPQDKWTVEDNGGVFGEGHVIWCYKAAEGANPEGAPRLAAHVARLLNEADK